MARAISRARSKSRAAEPNGRAAANRYRNAGACSNRSWTTSASAVRPARNAAVPATEINTVVAKGPQGQNSVISTSTRLAAARGNDVWMRVVMLAPSASDAMSTTVLGDTDMTLMRGYFIKPQTAIAMTFSDDPMMGIVCDRFTGSATARLATQSFVLRTASLR